MSDNTETILEDFPGVEDCRRGRLGRFPSVTTVSDSVPDSAVAAPESDENSSTSSGVFLILLVCRKRVYFKKDFIFQFFWTGKFSFLHAFEILEK
jgi:hypothetical protein